MTAGPAFRRPLRVARGGAIRLTLAAGTMILAGCRLIGGGGPPPGERPPPDALPPGVVYQGALTLDGGEIPAGLELRRDGLGTVWAGLETISGLKADGSGRLRGQTLDLTLSYGGDCPGRLTLEGTWDQEGGVYRGAAEAFDCTGAAAGTFLFTGLQPDH